MPAYTAKPDDAIVPPDVPDGWTGGTVGDWPFPGPYPPGFAADVDCTIDINTSGGGASGSLMSAKLQLKVYDEEDVLLVWAIWSGTHYEASGNLITDLTVYIGELPEGSTYVFSVTGGTQIDLNVEISEIESDKKYVFDGYSQVFPGNPTGTMTGRLFSDSDQAAQEETSTATAVGTDLSGVLHAEIASLDHDGFAWIDDWGEHIGSWPST